MRIPQFDQAAVVRWTFPGSDAYVEDIRRFLTAEMVDEYMGPVLAAARDGDLARIRHVP